MVIDVDVNQFGHDMSTVWPWGWMAEVG
jgi:hypothetical protein